MGTVSAKTVKTNSRSFAIVRMNRHRIHMDQLLVYDMTELPMPSRMMFVRLATKDKIFSSASAIYKGRLNGIQKDAIQGQRPRDDLRRQSLSSGLLTIQRPHSLCLIPSRLFLTIVTIVINYLLTGHSTFRFKNSKRLPAAE